MFMKDDSGYTPLIGACWSGHVEVAEKLLDHGADVNYRSKVSRLKSYCVNWHAWGL